MKTTDYSLGSSAPVKFELPPWWQDDSCISNLSERDSEEYGTENLSCQLLLPKKERDCNMGPFIFAYLCSVKYYISAIRKDANWPSRQIIVHVIKSHPCSCWMEVWEKSCTSSWSWIEYISLEDNQDMYFFFNKVNLSGNCATDRRKYHIEEAKPADRFLMK